MLPQEHPDSYRNIERVRSTPAWKINSTRRLPLVRCYRYWNVGADVVDIAKQVQFKGHPTLVILGMVMLKLAHRTLLPDLTALDIAKNCSNMPYLAFLSKGFILLTGLDYESTSSCISSFPSRLLLCAWLLVLFLFVFSVSGSFLNDLVVPVSPYHKILGSFSTNPPHCTLVRVS